ncbi:nicotinate-nucleotide--dimethylbenzimidazole phosphoribosyltransferase [Pontivivens insulae]|uniref:Nicotinate-nucleotide--dimethylbenzimidazole phosphoribosyltransferase n=1 Tax=Pontivivens insulae TaxID=1639689 RepID=A0A2R8ABW6_9RHOB|nr:nicotinate-nucleotide--dimethylbenzimidazole phosphoribosyltransferase [Pontivivens insulae]RED11101.1 nicotinate-nucleotide-dimethylbenzimidazole phosphoribosyltransferase [Pontivivens insulae]SPF29724.1 Nicotinate-nucleotide--dimethylbenzimidazole phosphoribosyltransferase [Pontivivens insulae]
MRFPAQSFADLTAFMAKLPDADGEAIAAAKARDAVLTKPPGALGRLEDIASWYAGWRGEAAPRVSSPQVIVFAGNHGVCAQGISAFPAEVTHQMVGNFEAGGAAINQLSDLAGAQMSVVALDLDNPTADFSQDPAMSQAECLSAMQMGWEAVDASSDLLVVGEMGIGNTTAAAAIAAALLGGSGAEWAGRGTGLDDAGVRHKAGVIDAAIAKHAVTAPLDVLATFGGREIAAMAGAMLRARAERMPVILDGFICSAAALVLHQAHETALDHCVAGHLSAEGAHRAMLDAMGKAPLLDLGLRLGEGSGAALAIQIVKAALACHSGMATFAEAGVSDG